MSAVPKDLRGLGVETRPVEVPEKERKLPLPMGMQALLALAEPEEEWLIEGLLQAFSNVLQAGYPKSFKTFFNLAMAIAMAGGLTFLGRFRVPQRRRVGLVLMEDQAHRVKRRIERLAQAEGFDPAELEGWLHIWFRPPLRLNEPTVDELGEYARELDLDFLGIDNWSYVAAGDSNNSDEVTPQLQALSAIREQRPGISIQLTHHARKDPGQGGARLTDVIRNSSAFGAWYDTGYVLSRKDEQSPVTVRMEMRDGLAPDAFSFTVEDEDPAGPHNRHRAGGWLRVRASGLPPSILARREKGKTLGPALLAFVEANPGSSMRAIREGVEGDNRDIDAGLELLERDEKVRIERPEKRGQAIRVYPIEGAA